MSMDERFFFLSLFCSQASSLLTPSHPFHSHQTGRSSLWCSTAGASGKREKEGGSEKGGSSQAARLQRGR